MTEPADGPVSGPWFAEHSVAAALQWPDLYLYGAADPVTAATPLDRLRSQLSAE